MLSILKTRFQQGHRTMKYPLELPVLPERFRGRLKIDHTRCRAGCRACEEACPTSAISTTGKLSIDLGKCLFCTACTEACPEDAISYTTDHRLATGRREDLILSDQELKLAEGMSDELHKLMGRALRLREVSAAGCNACEADTNVLGTVGWDLSRFGIQFVASPRHADGIAITGPISKNMHYAMMEAYRACPEPRVVIAIGACAIAGGPYRNSPAQLNGVEGVPDLNVDLFIPGCPPHPLTILDGLLRLIRRL